MTFQQLKYVIEIAKCQSINKASSALYVDQSNLGRSVTQLEEELGIKIFSRTKKGIMVTDQGREFLDYAKEVIDKLQFIEDTYSVRKRFQRDYFSVSSMRSYFMARPLAKALEKIPDSDKRWYIRLKKRSFEAVLNDVEYGQSNIGVVFFADINVRKLRRLISVKGLEFHEIGKSRMHLVMRPDHPLLKAGDLSSIGDYPYIITEPEENFDRMYDATSPVISRLFENEPRAIISVNDSYSSHTMIANSDAYFISSTEWQDLPAFKCIPLEGDEAIVTHYYILRKNSIPDEITKAYIDELKNYIDGLVADPEQRP